jgi:hypothetical protein
VQTIYTSSLSGGHSTSLSQLPSTWRVYPLPGLAVIIETSSNSETTGNTISIGEYFKVYVNITIPGGTTLHPQEIIVVLPYLGNSISLLNTSIYTQPGNIAANRMTVIISVLSPILVGNNTATVLFISLVNSLTSNLADNVIVVVVMSVVLPNANSDVGSNLPVSRTFSYSNRSQVFTQSSINISIIITVPVLEIIQVCTLMNQTIAARTRFMCVIIIYTPPTS